MEETVSDLWVQMENSEPAPYDDVAPDLRALKRGDGILVIEYSGEDVVSTEAVAMSGVCASPEGDYVWYCDPSQYRVHKVSGRKVNVGTVRATKIMLKPKKEPRET